MVTIKSPAEIESMKKAGAIVRDVLNLMRDSVRPGVTTGHLDKLAYDYIRSQHAVPSFLHYNGFPASICASVNEQVVHGIPSDRRLEEGDIVGIDVGAVFDGFHGDAARTFAVGQIDAETHRLIDVTEQCFFEAVKAVRVDNRLRDIAQAVQSTAESAGFSVVRALTGHGIGRAMHEDPQVPNFMTAGLGMRLRAGMALAIEPMINQGTWDVIFKDDGWTVVTRDGKPSAHYENTVIVTEGEPILTTL